MSFSPRLNFRVPLLQLSTENTLITLEGSPPTYKNTPQPVMTTRCGSFSRVSSSIFAEWSLSSGCVPRFSVCKHHMPCQPRCDDGNDWLQFDHRRSYHLVSRDRAVVSFNAQSGSTQTQNVQGGHPCVFCSNSLTAVVVEVGDVPPIVVIIW